MKILVVSAHPDDEIIGMGGTLKKLAKFHDVFVLFLADGITARKQSGHVNVVKYDVTKEENEKMRKEIDLRKDHAKKALGLVGVTKMKFLDLPDNELDTVPFLKIVKEIEKIILEFKPKILFTHHHNDLNVDHRIAYEASITAARPIFKNPISTIISFEAVSSTDWKFPYQFNPNLFIEITQELKLKIKSLEAYKNEIRKFPHPRSNETVTAIARRWGSLSGYGAAEAFEIIRIRISDIEELFPIK